MKSASNASRFPLSLRERDRVRGKVGLIVSALALVSLVVMPSASAGPGQAGHEHHHHEHGAMHGDAHDAQMKALLAKIPAKAQRAKNPVKDTPEGQAKAKELYAKNCSVCHGEGGKGDGSASAGLPVKPADFTDADHQKSYTEGTMYWVVTNGWKESGMPGFAKTIPRDDRWRLVRHVLGFSTGLRPVGFAPGDEKGGSP